MAAGCYRHVGGMTTVGCRRWALLLWLAGTVGVACTVVAHADCRGRVGVAAVRRARAR